MDIKERLIKIITSEGLTSSSFADSIGVQRSSISHILSGRNKPSIDFLEKVFAAYPKYNAEWLIMGTGEVYKKPKQPTLFDFDNKAAPALELKEKKDDAVPEIEQQIKAEENVNGDSGQKISSKEEMPLSNNEIIPTLPQKKIDKIIILYSDRSFIEYHPS